MIVCLICNVEFESGKKLSTHVKNSHGLSGDEYTVKMLYDGAQPVCQHCSSPTRRVGYVYRKYCKDCSSIAAREGGKNGGKAPNPKKGKTKENDSSLLITSKRMLGSGNHFFGKTHSEKTLEKLRKNKTLTNEDFYDRLSARLGDFTPLTTYEDYYSRQKQYLELRCNVCQTVRKKTLQAIERGSRCHKCFPLSSSIAESEIADFVESLGFGIIRNDRKVLNGKEIDVWVPSHNFGIEYNGLYWHADVAEESNPKRHYLKSKAIWDVNGDLVHIFSDEWKDKQPIVKSMICHRLGVTKRKIFARDCDVRIVDTKTAKAFFDSCHIDGYAASMYRLGLFYENELVSCISIRIPRNKKLYANTAEICRFSTALDTVVVGGLSRLMKHIDTWAVRNNFDGMLTYAESRFGKGKGYENAGFEMKKHTGISYWYTNGEIRENRFKYRAKNGTPEKLMASAAGMQKIYCCGSFIYHKIYLYE